MFILKKIINFLLYSRLLFFLLISVVILSLNLYPTYKFIKRTPPDRVFAMIHNNVQDYFFYLSLMNEGANGKWLTSDPYSLEPHKPSIVFSYFLWFGKLGSLLHLPHQYTYHIIRIASAIILLSVSFFLILKLKLPYPRLAFFFFVFAVPLLRDFYNGTEVVKAPFMHWWTGMDAIRRSGYLPHHLIGSILLVFIIIQLFAFMKRQQTLSIILMGIGTFALSFVHTPSLMVFMMALVSSVTAYFFLGIILDRKFVPAAWIRQKSRFLTGIFITGVIAVLGLYLMLAQTKLGFPWSQYMDWEKNLQFPLWGEIWGALGILWPLAAFGAVFALLSRRYEYIFVSCWLFVPILTIPYAMKLGISNIRLIQGTPYLPLAILSVLGIKALELMLGSIPVGKIPGLKELIGIIQISLEQVLLIPWKIQRVMRARDHRKRAEYTVSSTSLGNASSRTRIRIMQNLSFIPLLILIIFIIYSLPTYRYAVKDQLAEYWPLFGNVYLDKNLFSAFDYINSNFPKDSRVLLTFYSGNMLPAFSHTVSYLGHFGYTADYKNKEEKARKFFSSQMSPDEAKEFILSNKFDLIFQGPEEKPMFGNYLYPEILKVVFEKGWVTLYTLK